MSAEKYSHAPANTEVPSFRNPESVGAGDVTPILHFRNSDGLKRQGIEMSRYPLENASNPRDTDTWVHVVLCENPDGGYSYVEVKDGQEIETFAIGDELLLPQAKRGRGDESGEQWRVASVKTTEAGVSLVTIGKAGDATHEGAPVTRIVPQSLLREYATPLDVCESDGNNTIEKDRDDVSTRPLGRVALQRSA